MKAHLTLTFALLLICTVGAARAGGTPDGLPPALETVCDMETGAAYGHCNAYCEAMDCDLANDGDPATQPHASATACAKVRSKFQQTTGRDVPCEVTCPCNVAGSPFAQVLAGQVPINVCSTIAVGDEGISLFPVPNPYPTLAAASFSFEGQWLCIPAGAGDNPLPITPAQGRYCAQLLEQVANSQSVTCGPFFP